ncbi:MAG: hypothetical protein QF805_25615, partial [Pirellulaceae bacterium]|nr:hypothetical protein [Pirellulaceae bacterium]
RAVLVIRNVEKVAPIDAFHDVLESLVRGAKALSRSRLVFTYTHSRNSKWLADLCTDEAAEWCLAAPLKQEHLDEWNLDRLTAADEKSEPQDADPTLDGCLAALDSPALAALLVVSLSRRPCSIALVRTVVQCLCADSNRDGLSGLQVSPLEFDSSVHRLLQQARECAPLEEADSAINRLIASGVVLHHEGGMLSTSNQVEEASRRLLAERGGSNIESNFHALMSSALYDLMFQQSSDLDALREYTHHRIQSFQDSAPEAGFPRQRLALRVLWQHRRQIAQEGCSAFAHACIDCVQDMWREAGESKQREHVMRLSCDLQADLYARQHQFKLAAELRVRQIAHRVVELDYADSVGGGDRSVDLESTWVAMLFACQQVESSDAYRRLGSELSGAMDAACQHASSSKALRAISHVVNLAECWKGMREFDAADELFFSALQALRKQRPTDPFSEDAIPVLRLETQTFRLLLSSHLERIEAWNWTSQYNDRLLDVARSLYDIGHERLLDYFNQCPIHEDGGAGDQFFAKMKRDFCSLRARINVHAGSRLHSKLDDGDPSREELDRRMKEIEAEFHQSRQHYKLANTLANQISDGEMAAHVCRLVQAFALILHSDVVLRRSVADADFNDDELRLAKTLIYGVEQNLATEKQYISWWYWLAWLKTQVCHEECMWAICAERQNGEDAKAVYESLADGVSSAMTGLEFLEATDAHTDYFKVLMLQFLVCHAFYCAKSVKSLHEFKRDWVKQLEKLGQHPHRHTETPPILRALSSDEVLAPVWNLVKKVNIAKRASLRQQIIDVERQVVELGLVDLQHRPSDSVFLAEDGRLEELR